MYVNMQYLSIWGDKYSIGRRMRAENKPNYMAGYIKVCTVQKLKIMIWYVHAALDDCKRSLCLLYSGIFPTVLKQCLAHNSTSTINGGN